MGIYSMIYRFDICVHLGQTRTAWLPGLRRSAPNLHKEFIDLRSLSLRPNKRRPEQDVARSMGRLAQTTVACERLRSLGGISFREPDI
jgi:hypothetical protein